MALLIILTFGIAIAAYLRYKTFINPISVFSLLWGVVFFLYSLNLNHYYDLSELGFWVFLLQIIFWAVGGVLGSRLPIRLSWGRPLQKKNNKHEFLSLIFYIFCTIATINLLVETTETISLLMRGYTFDDIETMDVIKEGQSTGLMVMVKIFIVFPTVYSISAITATNLFFSEKKKKLLVFFNILLVLLYALQHGGRVILLVFLCSYLFAYLLRKKTMKISRKASFWTAVAIIGAFFVSIALTNSRGVEGLWDHLYNYFSISVPLGDYWLNKFQGAGKLMYGAVSLNGFLSPIFIFLQGLGIMQTPQFISEASQIVSSSNDVVPTGFDSSSNAFIGLSPSFYADGGILGVILFNLLFAYFAMIAFEKIRRSDVAAINRKDVCIFIFLMVTIVLSFIRFEFNQYTFAMALVYILVLYRKVKVE